jgi:hypothetical protein
MRDHGAMNLSTRRALFSVMTAVLLGCSGGDAPPADLGPADKPPHDTSPSPEATVDLRGMDLAPDTGVYIPTPADIKFGAVHPLPSGEQIVFNDWNGDPNAVYSMTPDGKTVTQIFRAYRVWAMGVSRAADRIAFACGDPLQKQHYGITIGDAIQHTFIYDVGTQSASVVAYGNINDECHVFGPGDTAVYVCRRYDFKDDGSSKGYRIGRIDLPSKAFTFLTPDVSLEYDLTPQPTPDAKTLYFSRILLSGGSQQNDIMRQPLAGGAAEVVRSKSSRPGLSPDGTRLVFQDYTDQGNLWVVGTDGTGLTRVAEEAGNTAHFSPDGKQIAFLVWYAPKNCSHIDVVKADGSEAKAPRRLRDCSTTGEMITQIQWITR